MTGRSRRSWRLPRRGRRRATEVSAARAERTPDAADTGGATDPGPRPDNQDRWAAGPDWAVVCDGVGGRRGGAVAATIARDVAVDALDAAPHDADVEELVTSIAVAANDAVQARRRDDASVPDMATTLTMAVRDRRAAPDPPAQRWIVLQVGDSPAWQVGTDTASAITWDHSLAGELVRSGALTPEEAREHPHRHMITRAIGTAATVDPELFTVELAPGDLLVLASDGLSDVAGPEVVPEVLAGGPSGAEAIAAALVDAALERATHDNVTVVVVRRPAAPA